MMKTLWLMLFFSLLAGCAGLKPSTIVPMETSARPPQVVPPPPTNGSIYQPTNYRSIFGDYRARAVGDVLTLVITETVTAGKSNAVSDSKTGALAASLSSFFGLKVADMKAAESSSISSADKAAGSASYSVFGTIAVTVQEVLPNGNLLVSGEKQVGMDKGTEFFRVSGVVSPTMIEAGNTIPSTVLADARVEYRTNSQMDPAELMKSLSRIFTTVLLL
jgi:flagellar L-ring protein precursor FlgH